VGGGSDGATGAAAGSCFDSFATATAASGFCFFRYATADGKGNWLSYGISNAIICAISLIYFIFVRVRIPFAIEVLRTVTSIIQRYPGTQIVAFSFTILHFFWTCFYIFAAAQVQHIRPDGLKVGSFIYLLFSFYWVSEVIKNIIHVTVSGVVATWYFLSGSPRGMPANPTVGALKRSLSTSFGSICLGSLIVAILKTIRSLLSTLRGKNDNLLACFIDCCLKCIESLIRYFNHYAFCQVAIYGKTYMEAAISTWNLISSSGVEAILNDNIISGVLTMSCVFISLIAACASALLAFAFFSSSSTYLIIAFGVLGFIIGFLIMNLATMVLDSGVTCTFVCFAEDRDALRNNNPELFQRLMETYNLWG